MVHILIRPVDLLTNQAFYGITRDAFELIHSYRHDDAFDNIIIDVATAKHVVHDSGGAAIISASKVSFVFPLGVSVWDRFSTFAPECF